MIDEKKLIERLKKIKGSNALAMMFIVDVIKEIQKQPKASECLEAYLKAQEQGLLLMLPCKIGDTVYEIIEDDMQNPSRYIGEYAVEDISAKQIKYAGDWIDQDYPGLYYSREAAERALEERGGAL